MNRIELGKRGGMHEDRMLVQGTEDEVHLREVAGAVAVQCAAEEVVDGVSDGILYIAGKDALLSYRSLFVREHKGPLRCVQYNVSF